MHGQAITWFPVYTGPPDPVSSVELCAPENVAAFVGSWAVLSNRDTIEKRNATVYIILSETYWLIEFYQSPDSVITGTFDPATGEFLDATKRHISELEYWMLRKILELPQPEPFWTKETAIP